MTPIAAIGRSNSGLGLGLSSRTREEDDSHDDKTDKPPSPPNRCPCVHPSSCPPARLQYESGPLRKR